jgi:5'-nucleotidase
LYITDQNSEDNKEFKETIAAVKSEVKKLSEKTNRIICISHIGEDENNKLAMQIPEIDIIISGHKHAIYYDKVKIKKENKEGITAIVQAGRNGENHGILKVEFDEKGHVIPLSVSNKIHTNKL